VDQAVQSNIPTLVLSGGFDPITPPQYASTVASNLSNSYNFVFPIGAHGQMLDGDCADGMILAFLADPSSAPDSSCINPQATPDFITSQNTIDLTVILKLLNLDPGALLSFLTISMSLLFLWTSVLVFPLAWLIERSRRRPARAITDISADFASPQELPVDPALQAPEKRPALLLRRSAWFPVLASGTLSLFWLAFIIFTVSLVMNNDTRLFYGLSGEAKPWFILLLIFTVLSFLMLAAAVLAWVHRYGSVWRRLYYSSITFAALIIVGVLASWGMLSAIF
jgi:hypothetical protein